VAKQEEEAPVAKAEEQVPVAKAEEQVPVVKTEEQAQAIKLLEEASAPAVPTPVVPKKTASVDSNSNFLAAATLFGTEQQAELEESEQYTSKIAKAEYKKIEKSL
jgi:hypothetical protein